MKVLLVDPSRFTAPYDAALSQALRKASVATSWAVRAPRPDEVDYLEREETCIQFYRRSDVLPLRLSRFRGPLKVLDHCIGMLQLLRHVRQQAPDIVHFQWSVVPLVDIVTISFIRRFCPVIVTVHDSVPHNGDRRLSGLRQIALMVLMRLADRVIVHTQSAKRMLENSSVISGKLAVIPHGSLGEVPQSRTYKSIRSSKWTFVLFGQLKSYKGLDVLVEALSKVSAELRSSIRLIVAGAVHMDLAPIIRDISRHGLTDMIELRLGYLQETELQDLIEEADTFVLPYRQIDASGVYFRVRQSGRWIIASDLGIFSEDLGESYGRKIQPNDVDALRGALEEAALCRPQPEFRPTSDSWLGIARETAALYREAVAEREALSLHEDRATL